MSWAVPSISPEPPQVILQTSFTKLKPLILVVSLFNKLPLHHENASIIFTRRGDFPKRLSVCFSGRHSIVNLSKTTEKLVKSHVCQQGKVTKKRMYIFIEKLPQICY